MHRLLNYSVPFTVLLAACGVEDDKPSLEPDLPEAVVPMAQMSEVGPVFEGYLDRAALASAFVETEPAVHTTGFFVLSEPASRASMLATLNDVAADTPSMQVQAGWTSGQTGAWVPMPQLWAEGELRVLAADLETGATRIRFRILGAGVATLDSLRWAANIPLAAAHRAQSLPAPQVDAESVIQGTASYAAAPAACAEPGKPIERVVLYRIPRSGSGDSHQFLRALQALDQLGLYWCDNRANYIVGVGPSRAGRGPRQGALGPSIALNEGTIAIAVAGCEASGGTVNTDLEVVLNEFTESYALSSADRFSVSTGGACPEASPWLQAALDDWLVDAPFVGQLPPPPPPVTTGTIAGQIINDRSGAGLEQVQIQGSWGGSQQSGGTGQFLFENVPQGEHRLTVSKAGWQSVTTDVVVTAEQITEVQVRLTEEPEPMGVSVIDHAFLIDHFGGTAVDPLQFPETSDGFQSYLDGVGVTYFSAREYVTPNNPSVAAACGYSILLPERSLWPRAGALGLLADQLRMLVNEPVVLRNWWRPPCYNEGVGGAAGGDHPDGDALDLDFRSSRSRADAQRYLCSTYWLMDIVAPEDIEPGSNLNPRLNMSAGLGGETIHLGLLSRNGRRYWKYSSYSQVSNSGTCW